MEKLRVQERPADEAWGRPRRAAPDPLESLPTDWISVQKLLPADSPRRRGEDPEHTRTLSTIDAKLPPIIVHRASMRVIDGMHRLSAAQLRGDEMIEVRFFDGSEQEAFLLSVWSNIAHGMPLSLADRTAAAERIIRSHPLWSDRAIAATTGMGARTVGSIRRRIDGGVAGPAEEPDGGRVRVGRDGRVRPLDNAEGRLKASDVIQRRPGASLREIAREAGISPSTARDVRNRVQRGESPVPAPRLAGRKHEDGTGDRAAHDDVPTLERHLDTLLDGLKRDPSLRFSESGRSVLRWFLSRVMRPDEWRDVVPNVPPHSSYAMADVARRCADEWLHLANALDRRAAKDVETFPPHAAG